jgi:hypothetical protein
MTHVLDLGIKFGHAAHPRRASSCTVTLKAPALTPDRAAGATIETSMSDEVNPTDEGDLSDIDRMFGGFLTGERRRRAWRPRRPHDPEGQRQVN